MSVDFQKHLETQLQFIQTSCDSYDAGHVYEGVRIATALRVLFHQTTRSNSLLTHLGSPNIQLLSTCAVAKPHMPFFPAMTSIQFGVEPAHMAYVPQLQVPYERPEPFNKWWFREIVYLAKPLNVKLTRKDLILGAANKDGGAHVDSSLDPRYEQLLQGLGWSMTDHPEGELSSHIPCKNGHLAALRQMGYEVLHSPDLLKLI